LLLAYSVTVRFDLGEEKNVALTDTQKAYELIKERIITIQMRPGAMIQEADLISDLGLGRTPIREALKKLEAEKLVVVSPHRGTFVADVSISDLSQIQEIRLAQDTLCVRLAVERITPDELAEMRKLVEEIRITTNADDPMALMALDHRFHLLLAKSAHNEFLEPEIEMFYNLSMRIWYMYLNRIKPIDLKMEAFVEILEAIETKDVACAEQAMQQHIRQFGESVKQYL
jgi:DNA-binding GntR family transcriptional regulator